MAKQWKMLQTLLLLLFWKLQMVAAAMEVRDAWSLEENYDQPTQYIRKWRHYFADKGPSRRKRSAEELVFLNCGVGKDSWESLGLQRYNQSTLKEISPEYSLEGLMLRLKLQYFGHLIWQDPDAEKDWRQEEIGMTGDEMVGWHHQLDRVWASSGNWWWTGNSGML